MCSYGGIEQTFCLREGYFRPLTVRPLPAKPRTADPPPVHRLIQKCRTIFEEVKYLLRVDL